jgi:hypothetical protein
MTVGDRAGPDVLRTWVWVLVMSIAWWNAGRDVLAGGAAHAPAATTPAAVAVAFALAKLTGHLIEAAVYRAWWRLRAVRVSYLDLLAAVVSLSLFDLLGLAVRARAAGAAWLPWIVGPRAAGVAGAGEAGLAVAFSALGLLTLLRLAGTALVQRRLSGRGLGESIALTLGLWLATRLAVWWTVDLLRGRSPVPLG